MKFLKKRNFLLSLIVFLVIILTSLLIFIENSKILPKSSADLSISDQNLNIKFNITKADQGKFSAFLDNLGSNQMDQISLKLNQSAIDALSKELPTSLSLTVSDRDLKFKNQTFTLLQSVTSSNFEVSSGSGKLSVDRSGDSDFSINITDPSLLLNYATSSAQVYMSDKLSGLYPILSRVATINLEIHGKSISGEINLK